MAFQHPQSDRCSRNSAADWPVAWVTAATFSILNRIDVPETGLPVDVAAMAGVLSASSIGSMFPKPKHLYFPVPFLRTFSILNRIDVPETAARCRESPPRRSLSASSIGSMFPKPIRPSWPSSRLPFQHPQSDRCSRNTRWETENDRSSDFQHPQSDRCSRNTSCSAGRRASRSLSASSIGSMFPKRGGIVGGSALAEPFSILNRIDVPETGRTLKLAWSGWATFSILNRIDVPETCVTVPGAGSASDSFSILNRIDVPETPRLQGGTDTSRFLSASSIG